MISRILGLATAGGALADTGLLYRFLSNVATAVMLAIVGSFMLCAFMTAAFACAYMALVHYGLDPFVAAVMLGLVACFMAVLIAIYAVMRMRALSSPPRASAFDISTIADAFIDGFLEPRN